MEYVFSYIMTAFGATLILYGAVLMIGGNIKDMPYRGRYAAKMNDKKAYVRQVGRIVVTIGCAPLISGIVGFITEKYTLAAVVFLILFAAAIVISVLSYKQK